MTATLVRWTVADYHAMIDAGLLADRRAELLNGLILEMPPEGPEHADLNRDTGDWFREHLEARARVSEGKPIKLNDDSEPEPDIALIRRQSYRQSHPTAADVYLIIEFSNTSLQKDTDEKRRAYAKAGIPDYWVVNLRHRQLIVYRDPVAGDYRSEQRLTSGTLVPLAFPNIVINLSVLLP